MIEKYENKYFPDTSRKMFLFVYLKYFDYIASCSILTFNDKNLLLGMDFSFICVGSFLYLAQYPDLGARRLWCLIRNSNILFNNHLIC
jgi:hypothetical protein